MNLEPLKQTKLYGLDREIKELFNLFENTNNIKLDIFENFKEVMNLKFLKIRQPEPLFTKIE